MKFFLLVGLRFLPIFLFVSCAVPITKHDIKLQTNAHQVVQHPVQTHEDHLFSKKQDIKPVQYHLNTNAQTPIQKMFASIPTASPLQRLPPNLLYNFKNNGCQSGAVYIEDSNIPCRVNMIGNDVKCWNGVRGMQRQYASDVVVNSLLQISFPELWELVMQHNIPKVELWRYAQMYIHGGVHADKGSCPGLHPDEWIGSWADSQVSTEHIDAIFVEHSAEHIANCGRPFTPLQFSEILFAAAPQSPIIFHVLQQIRQQILLNQPVPSASTGPRIFTRAVLDFISEFGEMKGVRPDGVPHALTGSVVNGRSKIVKCSFHGQLINILILGKSALQKQFQAPGVPIIRNYLKNVNYEDTTACTQWSKTHPVVQTYIPSNNHPLAGEYNRRKYKEIWIAAYGRSASTMVQEALAVGRQNTFSLYEPCHDLDDHSYNLGFCDKCLDLPWKQECIRDVMDCDFSKINRGHQIGPPRHLNFTSKCREATNLVYKTISLHDLRSTVLPLLEQRPNLHVVYLERDPRAILTSQTQRRMNTITSETVQGICSSMVRNINVNHPRLHKIQYHEIISNPQYQLKKLMNDIGIFYGPVHTQYIRDHFDNPDCVQKVESTCKIDSRAMVRKWENYMGPNQRRMFDENMDCRKVFEYYHFDEDYRSFTLTSRIQVISMGSDTGEVQIYLRRMFQRQIEVEKNIERRRLSEEANTEAITIPANIVNVIGIPEAEDSICRPERFSTCTSEGEEEGQQSLLGGVVMVAALSFFFWHR